MEAVGGSVLSTTLQVLFDRIARQDFLNYLFPGNRKVQLKRLMRVLRIVSPVLEDAENKQDKSPAVRNWFNDLKHAVYQADDVLDEINTEGLRINLELSIGNCLQGYTDFSDQFIGEISPRLEQICETLERKAQRIGVLGLDVLYGKPRREDKTPTTSMVIPSQIFGRDDEKETIIQKVLSGEGGTDVTVIPITGMGGVGKTTLAQLVYNDERVKNHFQTRAWVCVSEEFDIHRVTKDLLMQVNSSIVDEKDDLNRLQVKLKDNLEGKRFIIILDDIWNDNYNDCHCLMVPLRSGSRGSKIIVTTRNENIALMLQNEPFHCVKPIRDDQSWDLFKLHAFDNRPRTSFAEFEKVGKTIVERCKGLPLAIKTIALALRSKDDIREWHDIRSSDNWMVAGDILPALSLSYKLLPSHLKCCFAFCAVFPKDVPFDKEEVALLWMANDLVQPSNEKVAQNYFEELRSLSFFEKMKSNKYVMHDLVNDLARIVSGNFCARINDYQLEDLQGGIQVKSDFPREVLHFSYMPSYTSSSCSSYDTFKWFTGLAQVQSLRTILTLDTVSSDCVLTTKFFTYILPKLRPIRALSLHQYGLSVIPMEDLKHLRFLNLTDIDMKRLPNDMTQCLNLQTLILSYCGKLEELPEDIGLLINLQHLDISGCKQLKKLPEDMGLLINLQHLDISGCRKLEELPKDMGLLINLQHLNGSGCSELLEHVGLLINLQHLDISGCSMLEKLPEDMGLLINLQHLDVSGCSRLKALPEDLRLLINLQHLNISGCSELEKLPEDMELLINLQHLNVKGCWKLEKLPEVMGLRINLKHHDDPIYDKVLTMLLDNRFTVEKAKRVELKNKNCIEELTLQWSYFHECSEDEDEYSGDESESEDEDDLFLNESECSEDEDEYSVDESECSEDEDEYSGDESESEDEDDLFLNESECSEDEDEYSVDESECSEDEDECSEDEDECSGDELNIFSELRPHTNVRRLSICGYKGTIFSNWLGDSSFCNIESLTLKDCKNCLHLPPLGQLTGLKRLEISRMNAITEVGEEFYGNSSMCKPFQVLEELKFTNMPEWTTWNMPPDNTEFLSLKEFDIKYCPKLVGVPFLHTSLRTLQMEDGRHPSISLSLQSCDVKRLHIKNFLHVEFLTNFMSLEWLEIQSCGDSTETIPLFSFTNLQELKVHDWESPNLFQFPNGYHQSLTSLKISECHNILSFPEGGLPAPNLKVFTVWGCSELKSLPEQMHTQLSSLYELTIIDCPEMECFPDGGLPHSLETLTITRCKKVTMFPRNWGLQRLPSLINLTIWGIEDKLFPEEGLLPATLQSLEISFCPNLEALNHKGFQDITSLQKLIIQRCPELRYLPEDGLPSSLSHLDIYNCPKLRYLPEDGLPSSLSQLFIWDCPKLKARIEREKGEEWRKVSHIPIILVDEQLIS